MFDRYDPAPADVSGFDPFEAYAADTLTVDADRAVDLDDGDERR